MCYPDSVLFHVRLRGLTGQEVEVLAEMPGFACRLEDSGLAVVRVDFAHSVPSWPDHEAMEQQLRLALAAVVPDAEIVEVMYGFRYARDAGSPAVEALHRLRRDVGRLSDAEAWDRDELAEMLTVIAREFTHLDDWLCNGGSVPSEWARRHPEGDTKAAAQVTASLEEPAMMAG
jgi:hypothetical protein